MRLSWLVSLPMLAKSARLNRLRIVLVASVSSIIVINATFLTRTLNASGVFMVPVSVFAFTFLPIFLILLETMSGANQSIGVLRAVGAKKGTVAATLLVTLVGAGLVGALGGEALGQLLAFAYPWVSPATSSVDAVPTAQGAAYVLASFAAGLAAGVVAGVRFSWNRLN